MGSAYDYLIEKLDDLLPITKFLKILALKSPIYERHSTNLEYTAVSLAKMLGLNEYEAKVVEYGASCHDIGKLGIPDAILNKPGKLDEAEFKIVKTHSYLGAELVKSINRDVAIIVLQHHERVDGTGYPYGVKNVDIKSQMVSIVDVFDALISERPYKKAITNSQAIEIIKAQSGKAWDVKIVDAFLQTVSVRQ